MVLNYIALGFNEEDNKMFQDAEQAITAADMWEWMKDEPGTGGYSMSDGDEMRAILKHMKYDGHSGTSLAMTMRQMQLLASLGIDTYCSMCTQTIAPAPQKQKLLRTPEMDKKVLEEYHNRAPFAKAPKWSYEYIKAFPDVLRNVRVEDDYKRPGVSDPTARRLNW
jgi:hypothetical protein